MTRRAVAADRMGRPRVHPEGTTAATRVAVSTAALRAKGGARKTFRLQADALLALEKLMATPDAPDSETKLVEQLLIKAARRVPSP